MKTTLFCQAIFKSAYFNQTKAETLTLVSIILKVYFTRRNFIK